MAGDPSGPRGDGSATADNANIQHQQGLLLGTVTIFSGQSEVTLWAAPALGPEQPVVRVDRGADQGERRDWAAGTRVPAGSSWFAISVREEIQG